LDLAFGVTRPRLTSLPELAALRTWRRAAGVDIEVIDAETRALRECDGLAEWTHELRHASPLRSPFGLAERYRQQIERRFVAARPELTRRAYRRFRRARNQAAASLARPDIAAQTVTIADCVTSAARFWLLALGEPYPSDKWLLLAVEREGGGTELVEAMRVATDGRNDDSTRYAALWELWRMVDERAGTTLERTLLAGSPFVRGE
jgi:hypothetical protein